MGRMPNARRERTSRGRRRDCTGQGAMTEYTPDTPLVARLYCPGCEPAPDPTAEVLAVLWCQSHLPIRGGLDDAVVSASAYLSGSSEAGGEDNRRWCEIFHRRR